MTKTLKALGITLGFLATFLTGIVIMAVVSVAIKEHFGGIGNLLFAGFLLALLLIGVFKEVYKSL